MIRSAYRGLGYYAGARWFSGMVAVVVVGGLALWSLSALEDMEERAEKLLVELTVRNMRTGMQLAMGDAITHGRDREIAAWAGANPVGWLGTRPAGYAGECTGREADDLAAGGWCFDRDRRELVYRPRRHAHLQVVGGAEQLRWRVAVPVGGDARGGLVGLRLENVMPYGWFLDYDKGNK